MVRRPAVLGDQLVCDGIGLVLALSLFVLDDATLLIELRLGNRAQEMSHAIRLEPQEEIERILGSILEIIGSILACGSIHVRGTDLFCGFEKIVVEVLTAIEHQVLEQMGETRLARLFVFGANVIPDVHGHDRRLAILMHNQREPIRQDKFRVRDFNGIRGAFLRGERARNKTRQRNCQNNFAPKHAGTLVAGRKRASAFA